MKVRTGFCAGLLAMLCMGKMAAADGSSNGPPQLSSAEKAAIQACLSSVSKDANGRPDRRAMETCMKSKGFSPPAGGPKGKGSPSGAPAGVSGQSSSSN